MKNKTTKKRYKVEVPIYTSGLLFLERDEELSKEDLLKSITREEMSNCDYSGTDWKSVRHSITHTSKKYLDEIFVQPCDEDWGELN